MMMDGTGARELDTTAYRRHLFREIIDERI